MFILNFWRKTVNLLERVVIYSLNLSLFNRCKSYIRGDLIDVYEVITVFL